jgi:hypothetical protein
MEYGRQIQEAATQLTELLHDEELLSKVYLIFGPVACWRVL